MEGLQDNVLGEILKHVPRNDQLNLLLVSRRWYQVMDKYVGLHVMLGRGAALVPINCQMDTPEILDKVGISTCEFISFCNTSNAPLKLKRPNLLRRVNFRNYVSSATLESILNRNVTNLHTLQLDHTALRSLEFSDINVYLNQCEVLEVVSDYVGIHGMNLHNRAQPEDKVGVVNTNAAYLFTKSFPGLKKINVNLPFTHGTDKLITGGLLTLLYNHVSSLTSVNVELTKVGFVRRWHQPGPEAPVQIPTSFKPITETDLESINLKTLELKFPRKQVIAVPDDKVQKLDDWKIYLDKLRFMESCSLAAPFSSEDFRPPVVHNATTLRKIQLTWDLGFGNLGLANILEGVGAATQIPIPVDCFLFVDCVNLTHLDLTGNWTHFYTAEPMNALNNVNSLPRTLTSIVVKCIPMSCAVCQTICLDFPVLRKLLLHNVSGGFGLGVQVQVVSEMIRRKQLRKFKVEIGYGTEPAIDPAFLNLTSRTKHVPVRVKAYLHGNGDYGSTPEVGVDSDDEDQAQNANPAMLFGDDDDDDDDEFFG